MLRMVSLDTAIVEKIRLNSVSDTMRWPRQHVRDVGNSNNVLVAGAAPLQSVCKLVDRLHAQRRAATRSSGHYVAAAAAAACASDADRVEPFVGHTNDQLVYDDAPNLPITIVLKLG